jgi:hypothetical protein
MDLDQGDEDPPLPPPHVAPLEEAIPPEPATPPEATPRRQNPLSVTDGVPQWWGTGKNLGVLGVLPDTAIRTIAEYAHNPFGASQPPFALTLSLYIRGTFHQRADALPVVEPNIY